MFRSPSHNIPQDVIKSIIKNHDANGRGRTALRESAEQYALQVDEMARKAGYPEELIQIMRARRSRPSSTELARSMFPVDSLPSGAMPIYFAEPVDPDNISDPDD